MRRSPLRGPPRRDPFHRPGGRRPPALGRGARHGAGVGGGSRWRRAACRRTTRPEASHRAPPRFSTAPAGAIFVKAVGAALNADSPELHRREAVVSAALPRVPQVPQLLDVYDDGDWVALAFVAVAGRPPAHPWDSDELHEAVGAVGALHETLTPNPVAGMRPAADRLEGLFGGWAEMAALTRPPAGLDEWAARNLGRLAELESGWRDAIAGSTLLHCDVRSDNLLMTPERRRAGGLAARMRRCARLRPGRLGALGRAGGRPHPGSAPRTPRPCVRRRS